MDYFAYQGGRLHAEQVDLSELAAQHGTPAYVYSRATIERHYRVFEEALAGQRHSICYSVKANGNLAVLDVLARLGAGFDIVSVGELERVLAAGGDAGRIMFSGVGKRSEEMARALDVGVRCFNVESQGELKRLDQVARAHGAVAPVALRVNPDVDARTHPYIATGLRENKFGIDIRSAEELYQWAAEQPGLQVTGVDCHIGSQLTEVSPFVDALDRVLALTDRLVERGLTVEHLDVGGGLGIPYRDETPPDPATYAEALRERLAGRDLELVLEPGRVIVGNAGILLTRVEYLKTQPGKSGKRFAVVDAGMNDLLRPALYDAWQEIVSVNLGGEAAHRYEVVGPVCESADVLGSGRELDADLAPGDLLAVRSAGAYGFAMASNYNARPRPPEIMVDGDTAHVVRRRETVFELMTGETLLPE